MKIKDNNRWREKIINRILKLSYRLDNTGNDTFEKNGEKNFITEFVRSNTDHSLTIFDVGANVGDYSQILLDSLNTKKDYSLYLFEPQKSCFTDLQKRFADNKPVKLNNFGLSDFRGNSPIYKDSDRSGMTSLYKRNLEFYKTKMDVVEQIQLETASDYIASKNIKHIDLLKIDVEGHEIKALTGFGDYLNSNFIDYIQFEYGGTNIDSHTNLQDFYNLLVPRGYKITKMMPSYLEIRDYNPRYDNFCYQNFVAVSEKILKKLHITK